MTVATLREADVSTARRKRWVRAVRNAQRAIGRLETDAVRGVKATLRTARANILGQLRLGASEFGEWYLPQVRQAAGEAIGQYGRDLERGIMDSVTKAAELGAKKPYISARALDIRLPGVPIGVPSGTLEMAQQIVPELIQAESRDLITSVGRELRMAFAGGQNKAEMTSRIEALLTKKLRFKDKQHRAETIVRTETKRIHAAAHEESSRRLEAENVKVRKKWVSALKPTTRPSHRAMHGVTVDVDKPFPWNRKHVGAAALPKGMWPFYPSDPRLPAHESINCYCDFIDVFEIIEDEEADRAVAELFGEVSVS